MKKEKIYYLARELGLEKEEIENFVENPMRPCEINMTSETADLFDLYKTGGHYGTISIKEF